MIFTVSVKQRIRDQVLEEAAVWVGSAMTYTLVEFVKDNVDQLITDEDVQKIVNEEVKENAAFALASRSKNDVVDQDAECRPRGWNWVDVVKHLSKGGGGGDE